MFSNFKTKFFQSKIFISVFCAILFFAVLPSLAKAATVPIHGWAWSDTIGWIQFDTGRSSPPMYNEGTGDLSGYAWSDNIGWIKFENLSANNNVGGNSARANTSTGLISGWARACAGTSPGDCSSMNSRIDGWDGWIKFDTGRSDSVRRDIATGDFHGYAWGSDVVGWISFNCKEGGQSGSNLIDICSKSNYKVYTSGGSIGPGNYNLTVNVGSGTVTVTASGEPDFICGNYFTCSRSYPSGTSVTLTATNTGGENFASWGSDCAGFGGSSVCSLVMNTNRTADALFANFSSSSSISGGGGGFSSSSIAPPPPPPPPPVPGACGTANNTNRKNPPTTPQELCGANNDAFPVPVNGGSNGPWTWTCTGKNGGNTVPCRATKLEVIIQEI